MATLLKHNPFETAWKGYLAATFRRYLGTPCKKKTSLKLHQGPKSPEEHFKNGRFYEYYMYILCVCVCDIISIYVFAWNLPHSTKFIFNVSLQISQNWKVLQCIAMKNAACLGTTSPSLPNILCQLCISRNGSRTCHSIVKICHQESHCTHLHIVALCMLFPATQWFPENVLAKSHISNTWVLSWHPPMIWVWDLMISKWNHPGIQWSNPLEVEHQVYPIETDDPWKFGNMMIRIYAYYMYFHASFIMAVCYV